MGLHYTELELQNILKKGHVKIAEVGDSLSSSTANGKSIIGNELAGKKKTERFDRQVSVFIRSYRHKLADTFGCSEKYLIDAIVDRGILRDDSTVEINEKMSHQEQIKIKKEVSENTIVTIQEIK